MVRRRDVGIRNISDVGFRLVDQQFVYGAVALFPKTVLSWMVRFVLKKCCSGTRTYTVFWQVLVKYAADRFLKLKQAYFLNLSLTYLFLLLSLCILRLRLRRT